MHWPKMYLCMDLFVYLAHATVLWPLLLLAVDDVLLPSASASTDNRTDVRPLWFSVSGSTTISCNSYDSGGVVVIVTVADCRVVDASVGGSPSTTTTVVAAGRDGASAGGSRDRIAL